jgi:BON domain-containing protein
MRFKFFAFITIAALAILFYGCSYNENANGNVNANANTTGAASPSPVANSNANETASGRRAPTREEYEREKARYEREAKDTGRKVGTGINDGWLWVKTRFDLAAVDDLRDSTINVDVDNAVVTLTGTVATQAQVTKADLTVKAVEGVKGVKNMLKVAKTTTNANTPKPKQK